MRDDGRIELGRLNLGWNDTRTERLLARVKLRIGRRARGRRALLASAALTSVVCVAAFALRPSPSSNAVSPAVSAVAPALIRLGDGSEIRVDPTASEVRVVEEQPSRVRVEAIRGRAHYSVVPNPGRSFEVASGSVTVRVVGTEFQVERREDKTFVEVSRGKVEVVWNGGAGREFISAGESGSFPRPTEPIAIDEGLRPHDDARAQSPSLAYRARVGSHDFRGAYAILSRHPALAGDTVKELLVAADVARLSEHPAEAVAYLQRIVREHPRDERAHQAAFTLGRTLSGLGRTKEAMSMFGRVRSDWPGNPLAEDALVRQAEAAGALGDIATARRLAGEYERDYPNGQRRDEVRRHARLE
jgi:transmembrane sensor